jgi:hypothetical protein
MRQKSGPRKAASEKIVKDIRRKADMAAGTSAFRP